MKKNNKVIWIAWERHRRTLEIADFLNIDPVIFEDKLPRLIRHTLNVFKTLAIIQRRKPKVLIVQNPSIVLTFIACLLHPVYRYALIVDSHNAGIIPESHLLKKLGFLYRYFQRNANVMVVTNDALAQIVEKNSGNPFILPDRIPQPHATEKIRLKGRYNIAYICTFKRDEPFQEVIEAVRSLDSDVVVYITGNHKYCPPHIFTNMTDNIVLTGFLSEEEYWNLLSSVDLIIDLTLRENCLVCGAYEAVTLECPMILSDTKALKSHFSKGVIFTRSGVTAIVDAVKKGLAQQAELRREISALKRELIDKWNVTGKQLKDYIYQEENCSL